MIEGGITDRWFKLSENIRTLYRDREAPQVHDELIELCLRQISMSKSMIHADGVVKRKAWCVSWRDGGLRLYVPLHRSF